MAFAALPVGCGSEGAKPTDVRERDERRPKLPAGWKRVVERRAGFNVGLPPGWRARAGKRPTLVRSKDRAVAVSISADRTEVGRSLGPKTYARRAARALEGYRGLRARKARRVRGARYPTAKVQANGVFKRTGLRQAIEVFAIHKRETATFTLIFFRSARVPARRYAAKVAAIVRSLRAQRPAREP